jgi:hypothetical protein
MTVQTNLGSFKGKVINAIPTHKAGNLISRSLTIQESSNAKQVIVGQKRVEFCQKIIFEFIF